MKFLQKLKTLVKKTTPNNPNSAHAHLSPISGRIETWIKSHDWSYEHVPADDGDELRTHHFIIGFRDGRDFAWNCLIRVHEKNQLISLQGILPTDIDKKHYLPVIAMFSAVNCNLGIGSLEFDVTTGTVRTKLGFDGEFTTLSDHALNSYLQGLASLTEKAHELINDILQDPNPRQDLLTLLEEQGIFSTDTETDTAGNPYFVPTHTAQ